MDTTIHIHSIHMYQNRTEQDKTFKPHNLQIYKC